MLPRPGMPHPAPSSSFLPLARGPSLPTPTSGRKPPPHIPRTDFQAGPVTVGEDNDRCVSSALNHGEKNKRWEMKSRMGRTGSALQRGLLAGGRQAPPSGSDSSLSAETPGNSGPCLPADVLPGPQNLWSQAGVIPGSPSPALTFSRPSGLCFPRPPGQNQPVPSSPYTSWPLKESSLLDLLPPLLPSTQGGP